MTRQSMPTRSWRSRLNAARQGPAESWRACEGIVSAIALMLAVTISLELDAGVNPLVHDVDKQVQQHGEYRQINGDRLDHREIAALHRGDHFAAEAGNG